MESLRKHYFDNTTTGVSEEDHHCFVLQLAFGVKTFLLANKGYLFVERHKNVVYQFAVRVFFVFVCVCVCVCVSVYKHVCSLGAAPMAI